MEEITIKIHIEPLEGEEVIDQEEVTQFENWLASVVASYDAGFFRAEVR